MFLGKPIAKYDIDDLYKKKLTLKDQVPFVKPNRTSVWNNYRGDNKNKDSTSATYQSGINDEKSSKWVEHFFSITDDKDIDSILDGLEKENNQKRKRKTASVEDSLSQVLSISDPTLGDRLLISMGWRRNLPVCVPRRVAVPRHLRMSLRLAKEREMERSMSKKCGPIVPLELYTKEARKEKKDDFAVDVELEGEMLSEDDDFEEGALRQRKKILAKMDELVGDLSKLYDPLPQGWGVGFEPLKGGEAKRREARERARRAAGIRDSGDEEAEEEEFESKVKFGGLLNVEDYDDDIAAVSAQDFSKEVVELESSDDETSRGKIFEGLNGTRDLHNHNQTRNEMIQNADDQVLLGGANDAVPIFVLQKHGKTAAGNFSSVDVSILDRSSTDKYCEQPPSNFNENVKFYPPRPNIPANYHADLKARRANFSNDSDQSKVSFLSTAKPLARFACPPGFKESRPFDSKFVKYDPHNKQVEATETRAIKKDFASLSQNLTIEAQVLLAMTQGRLGGVAQPKWSLCKSDISSETSPWEMRNSIPISVKNLMEKYISQLSKQSLASLRSKSYLPDSLNALSEILNAFIADESKFNKKDFSSKSVLHTYDLPSIRTPALDDCWSNSWGVAQRTESFFQLNQSTSNLLGIKTQIESENRVRAESATESESKLRIDVTGNDCVLEESYVENPSNFFEDESEESEAL